MSGLSEKVVLVTGGTSGIGLATVRLLMEEGAYVGACGLSAEGVARATELDPSGDSLLVMQADVRRREDCQRFVERVVLQFGRLDAVIHSAGVGHLGAFADTDEATYDRLFDTNVKGLYHIAQVALPHLVSAGGGHIVAIAGILGIKPLATASIYAASKYAVVGMCQSLSHELRRQNIRVSVLCPSGVDSPFWEGIPGKPRADMLLQPEDVAQAIVQILQMPAHVTPNLYVIQHINHQIWP
ncbi:MAG: SDR family oxidoreductase [Armatimonadota bacterium]|nr:SDR family oxidoreductase [bacterium]MCS7309744.1 SDR family oxidoreductase [Armatimonadota bacterium]MDW8104319.1 SDR family oxidoreductase [Armatimonadota bacterium]MDW8290347.1 SDR family oxidoreductase [Armatimonadota bacterium]